MALVENKQSEAMQEQSNKDEIYYRVYPEMPDESITKIERFILKYRFLVLKKNTLSLKLSLLGFI